MMKKNSGRRCGGLTAIELAVALAIAALLGALALPSFRSMIQQRRLAAAAGALAADLGEARQEAIRRGAVVHVRFGAGDGQWCWMLVATPPGDNATATDCAAGGGRMLKRVASTDHPGITLVDAQTMRLAADGASAAVAVPSALFANGRGEQLRVRLTRLGRPAICAANGALSGVPPCRDAG